MKYSNSVIIEKKYSEITKDELVKQFLSELKHHHQDSYEKAIRICHLCLDIGVSHNYSSEELNMLGYASIFASIGKLNLPVEILQGKELNENEITQIKETSRKAFMSLKYINQLETAKIVIAHYEYSKFFSSPRTNKERRKIKRLDSHDRRGEVSILNSEFAQIICIASIFDDYSYSNTLIESPETVFNFLKQNFLGCTNYIEDIMKRLTVASI